MHRTRGPIGSDGLEKSYVTLEQHVCPVCGKHEDTGSLLLDRGLRPTFEKHTATGYGLCKEHKALFDEGYVFLVAADEKRTTLDPGGKTMKIENAYRTGQIAALREHAFRRIFPTIEIPQGRLVFCQPEVIEYLEKAAEANG